MRGGWKHSDETRKRMSETHKARGTGKWMLGRKIGSPSKETIEKIRQGNLGRKISEETRKRLSDSHKGKRWTVSHRQNALKAYRRGENHPHYIKDRSLLAKKQERNDPAYREWRKSVRDRDGWKCKMSNGDCLGKVVAHHILRWADYPELRYEVNNGITLCHFHHPRKRDEEMRLSPFFHQLIED